MTNLISGKEALIALANEQDVEYIDTSNTFKSLGWGNAFGLSTNLFFSDRFKFRLKPNTIDINGIEVPAPFEPKYDCLVYILDDSRQDGFREYDYDIEDTGALFFGVWRTEDEIKQVVSALRSIFKGDVK